jgi:hypothetical protein
VAGDGLKMGSSESTVFPTSVKAVVAKFEMAEDVSNLWICYPLGIKEYHQYT